MRVRVTRLIFSLCLSISLFFAITTAYTDLSGGESFYEATASGTYIRYQDERSVSWSPTHPPSTATVGLFIKLSGFGEAVMSFDYNIQTALPKKQWAFPLFFYTYQITHYFSCVPNIIHPASDVQRTTSHQGNNRHENNNPITLDKSTKIS